MAGVTASGGGEPRRADVFVIFGITGVSGRGRWHGPWIGE